MTGSAGMNSVRVNLVVAIAVMVWMILGCAHPPKGDWGSHGVLSFVPESRTEIILGNWKISLPDAFPPLTLLTNGAMLCDRKDFSPAMLEATVRWLSERDKCVELFVVIESPDGRTAKDAFQGLWNMQRIVDRGLAPGARARVYVEMNTAAPPSAAESGELR
jgi:hypothetical protein